MSTGDKTDMLNRILSVMPPWFGEDHKNLSTLLIAPAAVDAFLYSLFSYLKKQMRIATADFDFLVLMANDYFGGHLQPRYNESTESYRKRIQVNILRERNTKFSYIKVLQDLTGRTPIVLEGFNSLDTNYLDGGFILGINSLGSFYAPGTIIIIAFRPLSNANAIDGLNNAPYSLNAGFSLGNSQNQFYITDDDILQAIEMVRMGGINAIVYLSD